VHHCVHVTQTQEKNINIYKRIRAGEITATKNQKKAAIE
jgi:hypothetical protein